jgi:hypothetical protein
MKKYKNHIAILAVLFVLAFAFIKRESIMKFFGKETDNSTPQIPTNTTQVAALNTTVNRNEVLKLHSTGASVAELQKLLNAHHSKNWMSNHLNDLTVDKVFGAKTEAMLYEYTSVKAISINQLVIKLKA